MDLNIRNVSEELVTKLKGEAVRGGVTLREYVIWRLGGAGNGDSGVSGSDTKSYKDAGRESKSVGEQQSGIGVQSDSARECSVIPSSAKSGEPREEWRVRKDVGHGTLCMCRQCEAKRRYGEKSK